MAHGVVCCKSVVHDLLIGRWVALHACVCVAEFHSDYSMSRNPSTSSSDQDLNTIVSIFCSSSARSSSSKHASPARSTSLSCILSSLLSTGQDPWRTPDFHKPVTLPSLPPSSLSSWPSQLVEIHVWLSVSHWLRLPRSGFLHSSSLSNPFLSPQWFQSRHHRSDIQDLSSGNDVLRSLHMARLSVSRCWLSQRSHNLEL